MFTAQKAARKQRLEQSNLGFLFRNARANTPLRYCMPFVLSVELRALFGLRKKRSQPIQVDACAAQIYLFSLRILCKRIVFAHKGRENEKKANVLFGMMLICIQIHCSLGPLHR